MNTVRIDDPDDPRLEAYRDIRERDLVGRRGQFVAEGKVVLDILLKSRRFAADSVLVLEGRLALVEAAIAASPAQPPVYVASQAVMDRVAGFPIHRGILAVGRRPADIDMASLLAGLPEDALVVVAVGIANHDNMGSIFRNAAAFGAAAVLIDGTCCDPLYRKAIRVSVGSVFTVPFSRSGEAADIVSTLGAVGFRALALSPGGMRSIGEVPRSGRTALFLGTEGEGLPARLLADMEIVRIPMAGGLDSLNVATAAAIALYELSGDRA